MLRMIIAWFDIAGTAVLRRRKYLRIVLGLAIVVETRATEFVGWEDLLLSYHGTSCDV